MVAILGPLGLQIFEATGTDVADRGEEHGHRVLRVVGKGTRVVLAPLPQEVGWAIDRAVGGPPAGPILLDACGRMDRHAATRRLAAVAGMRLPWMDPHMLRHTPSSPTCWMPASIYATSRSQPDTPTPEPPCAMTETVRTSIGTPTTHLPPTWAPGT